MLDELLSPLLTTVWGRRVGFGMLGLTGILLLMTLIQTIITWQSDYRFIHLNAPPNIRSLKETDQIAKLIMQLPHWHLFGKYGVVEHSAILPVTSLQIRLVGVIKSTPEKFSRVIISESNEPSKVYSIGDTLSSSGVKIYAITAEGVVLDNSGRLEKLPLPRTPLIFQGMPKSLGE